MTDFGWYAPNGQTNPRNRCIDGWC